MIDNNFDKFEEIFCDYQDAEALHVFHDFLCEFEPWASDNIRPFGNLAEAYQIVDTLRAAAIAAADAIKKAE